MGEPPRFSAALLDEIRARVSVSSLIGRSVKLIRAGHRFKALCPFHKERSPSFSISDKDGFYHCFGCGAHGDVFRWLIETRNLSFREAVEALAADSGIDLATGTIAPRQRESFKGARGDDGRQPVRSAVAGRWIWQTSVPARGSIVEAWLRARGLDAEAAFLPGVPALDRLRFHPACPVSSWLEGDAPERHWLKAPAMVAPVSDADGSIRAVHVTYLAPDGAAKAALPKTRDGRARDTRKMYGPAGGRAVWLAGPAGSGPLIAGEGIETSWAYAQEYGRAARVAAALSLENLQGGQIRLRNGAQPLWRPRADPDHTPFLIACGPESTFGIADVIVLVDADMKPLRDQKVQLARGARPTVADIDGRQRAELCAALASQHWKRAGAQRVAAVRPPMGYDFGDLAMGRAA